VCAIGRETAAALSHSSNGAGLLFQLLPGRQIAQHHRSPDRQPAMRRRCRARASTGRTRIDRQLLYVAPYFLPVKLLRRLGA